MVYANIVNLAITGMKSRQTSELRLWMSNGIIVTRTVNERNTYRVSIISVVK